MNPAEAGVIVAARCWSLGATHAQPAAAPVPLLNALDKGRVDAAEVAELRQCLAPLPLLRIREQGPRSATPSPQHI